MVPSYIRVDLKIGWLCVDLIWSSDSVKDRAFPTWWWKNIPERFQAWKWCTVLLTVWWWRGPCAKECRRACARRDWQQQRNGDCIPTTTRNWILPKISMSLDVDYSLELLNESTTSGFQPWRSSVENSVKPAQTSELQNYEIINGNAFR